MVCTLHCFLMVLAQCKLVSVQKLMARWTSQVLHTLSWNCFDMLDAPVCDVLSHHLTSPRRLDVLLTSFLPAIDAVPIGVVMLTSFLPAETVLYHMLPWLGAFAKRYVLPVNGLIFHAIRRMSPALGLIFLTPGCAGATGPCLATGYKQSIIWQLW